ncbi:T9SS type A sorting domain-containing protein [Hymenobacter sp. M29]|uniref:T9SS type A sorting domain-containing protein n=1 Tax=Hymenobacter mellowenesis TaxID=3063995 RepID=A0ABT9ADA4_9BACT|nr:CUB domain-containing protein [Hymenobacter sp. M29]MDO7847794.1 T9SS type A sorting domain-containing protein [Hymenobacter sp. M29]
MQHIVPMKYPPGAQVAPTPASRWWHLPMLLVLFLMAPKAWAQTYIIGTNQTTCAGTIYDSGGPNGDYTDNENLTTVITPATAGAKVRLNFSAFNLENNYDYLRIYDGPTAASPLLVSLTGTTLPGQVQAINATGQLTLVFTSDGSAVRAGFAAAITCAVNVPTVTSFTPTSGPAGTSVVITGTNFTGATAVSFAGTSATAFTINSATQITAFVPANTLSGSVCVTTPSGTGCSSANYDTGNYVIGASQAITTCAGTIYDSGGPNGNYSNNENLTTVITPATAGSKVVLTFSAFDLENNYDYLRIYDGPTASSTLIGAFTGTANPGSVNASATNTTGQLTLVFTSDGSGTPTGFAASIACSAAVPGISSFTPTSGLPGTSVVITGANFTGTTDVTFNNLSATSFVVNSPTQITAVVPSGATTGRIRVINTASATSSTNFTVPAPTVTSFTPTTGGGGTSVVVTGTNFTGATAVVIGGTGGTNVPTFTVNSATQITLTVPNSALGGPICVTTPAGSSCSTATFTTGTPTYIIGTNQTTCSGIIYDSGGASGQYTDNENRTTVLTPATTGAKISLTFSVFDTESSLDVLRIYDGPTASAALIGSYSGTTNPGTVSASLANPTGQLTLVFTSDGSVTRAGFAASIECLSCYPVTNLTATNVTTTSAVLNFTPGLGNSSYRVTYTPTNGTATTVTATSSPYTLTGLVPATPYTISIQPLCATGSTTATTTVTFTTLLPNDEPCGALGLRATPLTASNLGATTSVQNGINTPSCGGGPLPKDVWFTFTATATSSTLTLTGNAAGTVRVFTTGNCSTGTFAEFFCRGSGTNNTTVGTVTVPGLTAGTRYYVAVNGFGSSDAAGSFTIAATNVLATKAQANTNALVVYPNPSNTGQLTIKLNELRGAGHLTLFNALGQAVRTQALSGAAEQTISTQALATGLYTLRVTVGEQVLTRKVVLE